MKTPADKRIVLTFHSHPTKSLAMRWKARLVFAPASDASSILPVEIADGNGVPVPEAVFEFAGKTLDVRNGRASLAYKDFIAGKHEKGIWLYRDGMLPIPGGLTFE